MSAMFWPGWTPEVSCAEVCAVLMSGDAGWNKNSTVRLRMRCAWCPSGGTSVERAYECLVTRT